MPIVGAKVFLTAASVVAIVLVAIVTALVVVVVIGLHVWGAIQDGRSATCTIVHRARPQCRRRSGSIS